jgi:hypothetical protein
LECCNYVLFPSLGMIYETMWEYLGKQTEHTACSKAHRQQTLGFRSRKFVELVFFSDGHQWFLGPVFVAL